MISPSRMGLRTNSISSLSRMRVLRVWGSRHMLASFRAPRLTVSVGLVWDDEVLWNVQRAAVITAQEGRYPEAANEVMAHRDALAACGLASLGVGDHFTATVETNAGVQTLDFVISGLWEGYGDTSPLYVSRRFWRVPAMRSKRAAFSALNWCAIMCCQRRLTTSKPDLR